MSSNPQPLIIPPTPQTTTDINTLSHFLSNNELNNTNLATCPPVDCIVICASAILYSAEVLFRALESRPNLTHQVVLCGGIGHSTKFIYEAVANHPRFASIAEEVTGLPEARVLERILDVFFDGKGIRERGCEVLVEDQSTNCGSNAMRSREVLERASSSSSSSSSGSGSAVSAEIERRPHPQTFLIIQDPTMMRRTKASFEKAYQDIRPSPRFISYPTFVPEVQLSKSSSGSEEEQVISYSNTNTTPPADQLWDFQRFYDLIMGEIPRLRDDENGYGLRGKGFITHVDVPVEVEGAWERLRVFKGVGGR